MSENNNPKLKFMLAVMLNTIIVYILYKLIFSPFVSFYAV